MRYSGLKIKKGGNLNYGSKIKKKEKIISIKK